MPCLSANGIRIAYDTRGERDGTPILLLMAQGLQLTAWPEPLVDGLAEHGFFVIRMDNRDCGLSTRHHQSGSPNRLWQWVKAHLRLPLRPAYTLDDMAADAAALLDALNIERAHVVGVSMGARIAQVLAAQCPERVLSLTSLMSSSGKRSLPGPTREARAAVSARPPNPRQQDAFVAHMLGVMRTIGSPSYPTPERVLRAAITRAVRRSYCPAGADRQRLAVKAAGDRSAELATIRARTLVIHGSDDPLLPPACGEDVARCIPGARLEIIPGMGHDLPGQLLERLLALIVTHAHGKMLPDPTVHLFEKQ